MPEGSGTRGGQGATARNVKLTLTAENFAFDRKSITVPQGSGVTIVFNNKDSGVPHNFAVYQDVSAQTVIFRGDIITGPDAITYGFTAPALPGKYFFRCDIHPAMMTGDFIVQ